MPGIVGLITSMPRERAEPELGRMIATLHHDSSYRTGAWIDESAGVYVGWAEREHSHSAGRAICNERRDVVLVFSGEEFAEPGTAHRLEREGHELDGDGPSYLVHLYEEDDSFPAGLNGRFHGLLVDRARGKTMLFNDRYGMHRIYYHESSRGFYFAAEAKAILAVRPELRRADRKGLGELIACGCVMENRTVFDGVHVLPGAAAWTFENGTVSAKRTYFSPQAWENQDILEPESYYREVRETFSRNLPRYFEGRQRIAMSLTGGLDTRMILAWQKRAPGSLPCYTFGGMVRDCRDIVVARKVARSCRQPYQVIPVGEEFLARFSSYAERTVYLSDGCADVSRSSDLYVNEKARHIAPVRMTGNYGGEVLRKIRAFKPREPLAGLFRPELLSAIDEARNTYAAQLRGHPVSFAVFKQAPWHHYGLLALEETHVSVRSPYLDNDLVRTVFRAPKSVLESNDTCLRLIADGDPALRRIATDHGPIDAGLPGALSRGALEFLRKAEYAYDSGMPQWLASIDHVLSPLRLERLFLGWHKFYHFRVWYRDQLSEYVRETLLDAKSLAREYIEPKRVRSLVGSHLKGDGNYTAEIHQLLTLELLHRLFVDADPAFGRHHPITLN